MYTYYYTHLQYDTVARTDDTPPLRNILVRSALYKLSSHNKQLPTTFQLLLN